MHFNLGQILANRAFLSPTLEACVGDGYRFDYRQANARANRFAAALIGLGLAAGDRIALLCKNNEHATCALYGAAKVGIITAILNWRLTAPELEYILNDCGARLLIYDGEFAPVAEALRGVTAVETFVRRGGQGPGTEFEDLLTKGKGAEPVYAGADDDPCVLMYTSGTTGKPKGAMISHRNTFWASIGLTHTLRWAHKDRYLLTAPLFHIGGLAPVLANVHVGVTTVYLPDFHPVTVFETIARERVNFLMTVPLMLQAMAMVPPTMTEKLDLTCLRHFVCGASPVPESLIRLYDQKGFRIAQVYGATEYTGAITFWTNDMGLDKCASAGKPVFHGDVKVFKPGTNHELPADEVGELCLFGPQVFQGYWRNPEATEAALVDGCFRSGDLGKIDGDGCVYVIDRLKDMIISGGENIYPAEIEAVLAAHPAVAEVAVAGKPDERWGEIPVAFIALKPEKKLTEAEVIGLCRDRLAGFKCVKEVRFVEAIPKNATGKMLKNELRRTLAR
ncbi:MAG: long-chain-fatty-acid--CoA ligase [Desulfobacteraceae bacterium]|nr:long-chain-fatty-acid--CoA ligase [Desulfobacteraceae bacterium]MDD3991376.1 long-chain-fatty-acid--CoA ligase [Desulfobacteraceae bacterium]